MQRHGNRLKNPSGFSVNILVSKIIFLLATHSYSSFCLFCSLSCKGSNIFLNYYLFYLFIYFILIYPGCKRSNQRVLTEHECKGLNTRKGFMKRGFVDAVW